MSDIVFNPEKYKTALLLNSDSGRLKKDLPRISKTIASMPTGRVIEASNLDDIHKAVDIFIKDKVNLLIIAAGDGTIQAILSVYLCRQASNQLPAFILLPGGTTNMSSRGIGQGKNLRRGMLNTHSFLMGRQTAKCIDHRLLKVSRPGQPDLFGMFFGTGIIARGSRYFQEHIRQTGITGEKASFLVVLNLLFKYLTGGSTSKPISGKLGISCDQDKMDDIDCLLLLASTLDRLLFGLKPYWGEQQQAIRATWLRNRPAAFWRSLFKIAINRHDSLRENDGYYSRNLGRLELHFAGDFILDGEVYNSENNIDPVSITSTNPIKFIVT